LFHNSLITIFSVPKPFNNSTADIQINAIQSWQRLEPTPEIILCGDDPSVIEVAREQGVNSMTSLKYSSLGTPLLNSVFSKVHAVARYPILCYLNTDIIFFQDLVESVQKIHLSRYLAVGQRTDLDLVGTWDFSVPNWQTELQALSKTNGKLHSIFGIDYFIFTANSGLHILPPFIVGRPRWDNWFIFNARKNGVPVVDITGVNSVIHQNHDYAHIPDWKGQGWSGPETDHNSQLYNQLIGAYVHHCNIQDATHILTPQRLQPAISKNYLFNRLQTTAMYKPILRPFAKLIKDLYIKKDSLS